MKRDPNYNPIPDDWDLEQSVIHRLGYNRYTARELVAGRIMDVMRIRRVSLTVRPETTTWFYTLGDRMTGIDNRKQLELLVDELLPSARKNPELMRLLGATNADVRQRVIARCRILLKHLPTRTDRWGRAVTMEAEDLIEDEPDEAYADDRAGWCFED